MTLKIRLFLWLVLFCCTFLLCCNKKSTPFTPVDTGSFSISGSQVLQEGKPVQLIGANSFHVFAAGSADMNGWQLDIDRVFIGNAKETPPSGNVIRDANGAYLYPLQTIADSNRIYKRITILVGFGWDGSANTLFTGTRPSQTPWWNDYKISLRQWAIQFRDQPDVWLEPWNEPYRYDGTDGYSDDIWMSDMNELLSIIRSTGNNNIVLIPCAAQGQDESVLINKGGAFLAGKKNILFDIHAYEKWLPDSNSNIGKRLAKLQQNRLPVIFGETAPMNAGLLMNPQPFLDSVYTRGFSLCAWAWKYDATDQDALLDAAGAPNNRNNNNWGSMFRGLAARTRKP